MVMQRSSDEAMKCPGLDHLGKNKKGPPNHNEQINRLNKT